MLLSFLAGLLIAMSGTINLAVGGDILGAILFSLGLLTILHFQLKLFTGKAGLLATNDISIKDLCLIWCGNLLGCDIWASMLSLTNWGYKLVEPAAAIINIRISNSLIDNMILGICCGLLMYVAVNIYKSHPWATVMCVAAFILAGFNHCVADMFYFFIGTTTEQVLPMIGALVATTIGNIIGCNIISFIKRVA